MRIEHLHFFIPRITILFLKIGIRFGNRLLYCIQTQLKREYYAVPTVQYNILNLKFM